MPGAAGLRAVSSPDRVGGGPVSLPDGRAVPWSGQKPHSRSSSKLDVVEHHSFPSARPAVVHCSYFLPRNLKGKTQGAPFEFPPTVDMAAESGTQVSGHEAPEPAATTRDSSMVRTFTHHTH